MKITISQPQKSEVTIHIEVEENELEKYIEQSAGDLSRQVKISGFRPGKIPRPIMEQQVGIETIRMYALDRAIPQFYAEAVLKNNVPVVSKPQIKILQETPFIFEAIVAILPEVKLKAYDKIKIPKESTEVKEEDVEETLTYFKKQYAETNEVDRPATKGDRVEIDFDGFNPEGDVPIENTSSKNHPVVLGEGMLIPGFEEEIEGMKTGEEKTFEIQFPKDYHSKKLKDKKVKFKIKLNRVSEVKYPELTEEWFKSLFGEEKTVEEFKKEVRENLVRQKERQERERREAKLFEELIQLGEIELPEALIDEEIDFILDRTKMNMESRGVEWESYVKQIETENRDLRKENREKAEKQIKLRLILQHLIKEKEIAATEEEINKEIEKRLSTYSEKEQSKAKKYFSKGEEGYNQLKNSILFDRLIDTFIP
ncbi:MAG: hypothetical protein ACD_28C00244G0011 [uncultured bacterium]|nr:MAG: hypothetical protein ACD_28C00244G0011 [uncultured bacterium]KKT75962.1 MAG: Trigger factor [Candidatus Peregrinibacteria bacterium GW2011_GWA2_44_7]